MPASESIDLSREPLATSLLSVEQKQRLTEILDRYLSSLEDGIPIQPEALVKEHPDLADTLRAYLSSLDELHGAAAGFGGGTNAEADCELNFDRDTKRLGDFIIGRELGRGGMGIVYEARQISLDRTVALKVLPFAAVLDSKQIARFKSEAQAAAQILHPNIVPVFAIGVDRGVHFYAMQFIDGQPLDLAIASLRKSRRGRRRGFEPNSQTPRSDPRSDSVQDPRLVPSAHIPQTEPACNSLLSDPSNNTPEYFRTVATLGIQASEALHAAHEHGIVHRDIKPSNLLLDFEGKLWVTDFGLARFQQNATFSRTGDIVGTMRYMSPEQASGQTSLIDQRADVYSLGVTLYELLALEPAMKGDDSPALIRSIDQHNPRSLRKLLPKLPTDLENVVLKAMAKDREDRYTTAKDFSDDLHRFLNGQPTIAKPPSPAERIGKWAMRHKRVVAAVASVSLLACIGFAVSTILIAREKLNADRNYGRAESNFRDAQEAVDRFGAQFAERLAAVPGAGAVRRDILQDTLAYYQRFVEQAKDDPALQVDLAMTYGKIGALAEEIGSTEEAIAAYERAIALFNSLAATEPRRSDHQRRLALCRNNLAMSLRRSGRVEDARIEYLAAIKLQRNLARYDSDERYLSDLAISHTNLGLLWAEIGDRKRAEQSFYEAKQLQLQLVTSSPDDADHHRNLAATFNNLSTIYVKSDPIQAIKSYESALAHQQIAVASQPVNSRFSRDLAATFNNLGSVQSRQLDYAAAAVSYEKAIELQQDLLNSAPAHKSYRQDLAISFNNLGLMQSRLHKPSEAERAFNKSIRIQETIVALHPDDLAFRSTYGGVYNNLGLALEGQGRLEDAVIAYQKAAEQQRIAHTRSPSVNRYRIFLSKHYFNLGRVLRQLGQPDRAAQIAIARRDLWPTDGDRLFSVAEELALSSRALRDSIGKRQLTVEQATSLTLETLAQSIEAGFQLPQEIVANEAFSAFQDNQQFLQLVGR